MFTDRKSIAPYVSSPMNVVRKMLEVAEVRPGELVYDLGCGDGRIPIMAAQEFGAMGVGVDVNKRLVEEARRAVKRLNLEDRVQILNRDIFEVDLHGVDVITLYLTTSANEKVRPKLEDELRTGARVVSHDFSISHWTCGETLKFREDYRSHTLYLYKWNPEKCSG